MVVDEEAGKLVCRILKINNESGLEEVDEVVTLEIIDNNERIKQTLKLADVVSYRWYIRDSSSAFVPTAATSALAAKATATTTTTIITTPTSATETVNGSRKRGGMARSGSGRREGNGEEEKEEDVEDTQMRRVQADESTSGRVSSK